MPDNKTDAVDLENAKEALQVRIKEAVEAQERPGEPERINVAFSNDPEVSGNDEGELALIKQIRSLVQDFEQEGVVRRTDVQVRRVMALDSDADGEAAVDVEYDYSVKE